MLRNKELRARMIKAEIRCIQLEKDIEMLKEEVERPYKGLRDAIEIAEMIKKEDI